jgi:hypothetical protein
MLDVVRVMAALPGVERLRTTLGPQSAAEAARTLGRRRPRRTPSALARLRRAIAIVDRLAPGGANCLRRALLEIALDAGAAEAPLVIRLQYQGGRLGGHAWLSTRRAEDGQRGGLLDIGITKGPEA